MSVCEGRRCLGGRCELKLESEREEEEEEHRSPPWSRRLGVGFYGFGHHCSIYWARAAGCGWVMFYGFINLDRF